MSKKQTLICPKCKNPRSVHHKSERCIGCSNQRFNKAITLKNLFTGETVSAPSISKFCEERPHLGKNAKYHFSEIIQKRRIHHKGWVLPENYRELDFSKVRKVIQIRLDKALNYGTGV